MKKIITSIAALAVLGGGGFAVYNQTNDSPQQTEVKEEATEEVTTTLSTKEKEVEEVKTNDAPTERTTPINGMVWDSYSGQEIINKVKAGETLYLFSDATALEEKVLTVVNGDTSKVDFVNMNVMGFVANLQEHYPDQKDYFDKLTEVQDALFNKDYATVKTKIEEAKQLREG